MGSLNRHSRALGNDPKATDGEKFRGQRVYCSNRGLRGGCGRTFAFFLADILPRHTLTASLVWPWLVKLLAGLSLKAAAEELRLAGSAAVVMPSCATPWPRNSNCCIANYKYGLCLPFRWLGCSLSQV
jgi:hypothetical protein